MKVKITFAEQDKFVASAIRGLANAIEGFQVVRGQTDFEMYMEGSLTFPFKNDEQARLFERLVRRIIALEFQDGITIELIPN